MRSWLSTPFSPARRVALAVCAIAVATILLRVPISDGLVVRGDGDLYRANLAAAMQHYRRALVFDPGSVNAADRLLFVAAMRHRRSDIIAAIKDTAQLLRDHRDARLFSDRALCYLVLRRYDDAYADFAMAAQVDRSAVALTFAGYAARRTNHIRDARRFWQEAALVRSASQ